MLISKRHKRPSLRTKVARSISEIPQADWNKIYPETIESYDLFRTLDASVPGQFFLFYIMVYDGKSPVGAAPCFVMDYPLDTSVSGPLKRIAGSIRKVAPNALKLRALICGSPLGPGNIGIAGDKTAVMAAILRKMEQVAKKKKAAIVAFKDFDSGYLEVLDPFRKSGFLKMDSLPAAELSLKFRDFEGYLNTLSAESRYGLRRKFRKVDGHVAIGLEVVDSPDDAALKDIYKLYLDVNDKHGGSFETVPEDFFRNISKNMPGRAKFFLWRIDGKIVKFLLALASEGTFIDYYVGFDYSVAHKYHLYFTGFRDTMNWCIENNIKKYKMGITGYEAKRRLGFGFVPLHIYVKLRSRALRPVFNLVCRLLKFENFDPSLKRIMV